MIKVNDLAAEVGYSATGLRTAILRAGLDLVPVLVHGTWTNYATTEVAAWVRSQMESPDGWAYFSEVAEVCGLAYGAVVKRVARRFMRTRTWGLAGKKVVDLDDWYSALFDDNVESAEESGAYLPHAGETECPRCGDSWNSPDRNRARYCDPCRQWVRKQMVPDGWVETGVDFDCGSRTEMLQEVSG